VAYSTKQSTRDSLYTRIYHVYACMYYICIHTHTHTEEPFGIFHQNDDENQRVVSFICQVRACVRACGVCVHGHPLFRFLSSFSPLVIVVSLICQVNGPREGGRYNLSVALLGSSMEPDSGMFMGESFVFRDQLAVDHLGEAYMLQHVPTIHSITPSSSGLLGTDTYAI
jgi:hypothetical protein